MKKPITSGTSIKESRARLRGTVEIPIAYKFKAGHTYKVLVDKQDADLADVRWTPSPTHGKIHVIGSKVEDGRTKTIRMHRVILERKLGRPLTPLELCDHINGNTLDNRRCNLRPCSNAENMRNRGAPANNTSGAKGVTWKKTAKKWEASVKVDGKRFYLGLFESLEEAAAAYNKKAVELHGAFHRPNPLG